MKKIIALCLSVMLIFSLNITAFASDLTEMGGSATSTINYVVNASYCVNIPETINANTEYTFTATSMNILANQQVRVNCYTIYEGNNIEMENEYGDTFNLTFSGMQNEYCVGQFLKDNLTSTFSVTGIPADGGNLKAGTYTGTAEFVIAIEEYTP